TGLLSVTNAVDADVGLLAESEHDYRRRQLAERPGLGTSTVRALRAELEKLAGVLSVLILENVTENTVDGVPPKGLEVVIFDGVVPTTDDDLIAQTIWANRAQAVPLVGGTSGDATDDDGETVSIPFSRASV